MPGTTLLRILLSSEGSAFKIRRLPPHDFLRFRSVSMLDFLTMCMVTLYFQIVSLMRTSGKL
jgi:hypothetical protein